MVQISSGDVMYKRMYLEGSWTEGTDSLNWAGEPGEN